MQWELLATWAGLLITIGSGVYQLGKQAQKINNQQDQIDELKEKVKESQETPVKLAALETDIKYLVREMEVLKNFLMQRGK